MPIYSLSKGDIGYLLDAHGEEINFPIGCDTHTGWVCCLLTDSNHPNSIVLVNGSPVRKLYRYLAPILFVPYPPEQNYREHPPDTKWARHLEERPYNEAQKMRIV